MRTIPFSSPLCPLPLSPFNIAGKARMDQSAFLAGALGRTRRECAEPRSHGPAHSGPFPRVLVGGHPRASSQPDFSASHHVKGGGSGFVSATDLVLQGRCRLGFGSALTPAREQRQRCSQVSRCGFLEGMLTWGHRNRGSARTGPVSSRRKQGRACQCGSVN